MSSHVPAELRRLVASRADWLCEYCLIAEADTFVGCQVDHIISEKHGGPNVAENTALACAFCNRAKGSDVGSITSAGLFCSFYHPRTDCWSVHFVLDGARIVSLTDIGEVTARIFEFNTLDRLMEREELARIGRYPSEAALRRM